MSVIIEIVRSEEKTLFRPYALTSRNVANIEKRISGDYKSSSVYRFIRRVVFLEEKQIAVKGIIGQQSLKNKGLGFYINLDVETQPLTVPMF